MFTFSDGAEPMAFHAVQAADIRLKKDNMFKFNNSSIWSRVTTELTSVQFTLGTQGFNMCMDNFKLFTDFIRREDKAPVSLDTTTLVLEKRKQIEEESFKAKRYS